MHGIPLKIRTLLEFFERTRNIILKFTEFGLAPTLEEGLDSMGFVHATPIQEQTIPAILANKDLIACAQTGTGKTAAYLLPVLNKITENPQERINTLVLVPTRELAMQIDQQVMGLGYFAGATSIAVYGGGDGAGYEQQKRAMREGANIIVATPGRLISHLTSGKFDFSHLEHLVLDEADTMLDMGFYDDILRIISYLPKKRQSLLFSATMPPKIRTLAKKILHEPEEINIAISKPSEGIDQFAYMVYDPQKNDLIKKVLADPKYSSVIVFASRKDTVKTLARELSNKGVALAGFHSDLDQKEREEIMNKFRAKKLNVLIGTDVISRGIDIVGIDLVVNYDVPPDPEDYVHRVGRTARAATKGTAITFINDKDQYRFAQIESLIGYEIRKSDLPEGIAKGPEYNAKARKERKPFNNNKKRRNNNNRNRKPRPNQPKAK